MGQKPEGSRRSEYWGSPQDRLFAASQLKNIIEIRWALEDGADPNGRDADGSSPLHYVCWSGSAECVDELLKADPFARSEAGAFDALSLARQNEDTQVMESLREIWARREAEEIGEAAPARAPGISRGGRPL